MSNIIPMVSASPPPLDEAPSFSDTWADDDDDDFGNFTGADSTNDGLDFSNCALPSPDMQSVVLGDTESDHEMSSKENSPHKVRMDPLEFSSSPCETQKKPSTLDLPKSNINSNGGVLSTSEQDGLGDSNENLQKLSGQSLNSDISLVQSSQTTQSHQESNFNKRESTTDSGMCSTDISPIPISDNTADFCDTKSSCSDADEMFTEVQSDSNFSPENPSVILEDSVHKHSTVTGVSVQGSIAEQCSTNFFESNADGTLKQCSEKGCESNANDSLRQCPAETSETNAAEQLEQCSSESEDSQSDNKLSARASDTESHTPPSESEITSDMKKEQASALPNDNEEDDWSSFVDPPMSAPGKTDGNSEGEGVIKTDVENSNISKTQTSELGESPTSVNDVQNNVNEDFEIIDNSETTLSHDSDVNDNTDSDSGHFIKCNKTSDVDDLELPRINNVEDDEMSSEVKSESENEQPPSEHSSDGQADSSPSEDCGTFQTASMGEDGTSSVMSPSSNNFAAFPTDENISDDDDWADFSSTPAAATVKNDADDFGDFSQTTLTQDTSVSDSVKLEGSSTNIDEPQLADNDDFGDFSTGGFQELSTSSAVTSTGWAAPEDFKSTTKKTSIDVTSQTKAVKQEKIYRVLASCFPEGTEGWGHLGSLVELLDNIIEKTIPPPKPPSKLHLQHPNKQKSTAGPPKDLENVWKYLRDIEKSSAGRYEWSDSSGNKKLFKTLKIDARNVLMWGVKKPGIPLYASNLGLLEPTREDQKNQENKKVDTLVDTSKTDTSTTAVNQDIPPAQFDWSGSGLTNPLDAKSTLLDLDLLAVNDAKNGAENKGRVFESDLLGGSGTMKSPPKTLQPLETILAGMKFNPTIKQVKPDENLSSEAARVINTLPDLSFMQAKVLMFPLRTVSEGSVSGGT